MATRLFTYAPRANIANARELCHHSATRQEVTRHDTRSE
jgi:hypothetical protein